MSIKLKTKEDIEILAKGGKHLAHVVDELSKIAKPGMHANELDEVARKLIQDLGDKPSFLGYKPRGVKIPYPAAVCVSINEEVVHGIPTKEKVFKEGDIVSIDCGLIHMGKFLDHAVTIPMGVVSDEKRKLMEVTKSALFAGIKMMKAGNHIGDIGDAIEKAIGKKYGIVRVLAGHGVGYAVHEDPYVPNFGKAGTGEMLEIGMVLAIEPMVNLGGDEVIFLKDGYTVVTKDKSPSAHFEHTVVITENGPEILTKLP